LITQKPGFLKILFLTTHNLATNPRLYKEIVLAIQAGHTVQVICFSFNNWSATINEQLKDNLADVNIIQLPAGKAPFFGWAWSVLKEKTFRIAGKYLSLNEAGLSQAITRRSSLLIDALQKALKPDLVIGHNPGALWPAFKASKKFNCRVGFDVEDYHPGEGNDKHIKEVQKKIMVALLPQMDYVSFAAPLIQQQVEADAGKPFKNSFTLLNYFPAVEFRQPDDITDEKIQLVWFSQNINAGRGLELILPIVKTIEKVTLHLIGNLENVFFESHLKGITNIIIHPPMKQADLHQVLSKFDIGLALDVPFDENRDFVLSNKLLAYLQAGLYVVATDTLAQQAFLNSWQGHGECFDYKINNAAIIIEKIIEKIAMIRSQKKARYKAFEKNNWEAASLTLLKAWANI